MKSKVKYERLLLISNILMLHLGTALISFGVVLRVKPWKILSLDVDKKVHDIQQECHYKDLDLCQVSANLGRFNLKPWTSELAWSVILLGLLKFFHSVLGIVGILLKKDSLLWLMNLVVALSVSSDYEMMYIITNNHDRNSWFHKDGHERLVKELRGNYEVTGREDNSYSKGLNLIMLSLSCCGITGPEDFPELFTFNISGNVTKDLEVAPACCDFPNLETLHTGSVHDTGDKSHKDDDVLSSLTDCSFYMRQFHTTHKPNKYIEIAGCYKKAFSTIYEKRGAEVIWSLMFSVMYQFLQVIFALMSSLKITSNKNLMFLQSSKTTGQSPVERVKVAHPKVPSSTEVKKAISMSSVGSEHSTVASQRTKPISE